MTVNGIVAEYNPFHNGHKYQLEESGRLTGADYTVVVMSGNFVQRGVPALLDKHTRAEMALLCGADLVLELPALYATASAEYFAAGAVALLDSLGVVTHLCFGSECGETEPLFQIARCLSQEPEAYRIVLRQCLKQGLPYPNARERALAAIHAPVSLLGSPNNILGVEYIRALQNRGSKILPVTIKRQGADYHEESLCTVRTDVRAEASGPENIPAPPQLSSALAIRRALYRGEEPDLLFPHMPQEVLSLLQSRLQEGRIVRPNDFSSALYYKMLLERESGYEKYLDVSSDLSDRIRNRLDAFTDFESFCHLLKSKELTYTRISRCLLHILLQIEQSRMEAAKATDYAPYARVLGFRKAAAPLLDAINTVSSIPLVTKPAQAQKSLPADAVTLLRQDILVSAIYQSTIATRTGRAAINEYTIPMVIL